MEEIKNLTEDQKQTIVEDLNKEASETGDMITASSIADLEDQQKTTIEMPNPDQLAARCYAAMMKDSRRVRNLLLGMSKRGIVRSVMAMLDFPHDKQKSNFQTQDEAELYVLGQNIQNNKMIVMHHHAKKSLEKRNQEKEEKNEQQLQETK